MFKLTNAPTRIEALEFISRSASFGNLGVFIGAGFSKAVLNNGFRDIALSWGELLKKVAEKLEVDYEALTKAGVSYPELASSLCSTYSKEKGKDYHFALSRLKREIADLTSWYPDQQKREKYSNYLFMLTPSWIITTNYDLVIESLLTGKAVALGPNDPLLAPRRIIPVYHLHGNRTNPEEIIIAQEDYVSLFRPNEYRQIKLALTIRESTTLILGYALSDVNVLTAIDWSNNVFSNIQESYPHDIIQIHRSDNPSEKPYNDNHGILIIETSSIESFFEELKDIRLKLLAEEKAEQETLRELAEKLDNPNHSMIEDFINNAKFRKEILTTLSKSPFYLAAGFISFINKCVDETWEHSGPRGAFEGYNENLKIILDILTTFSINNIPPAIFETTAYAFYRVSGFIGNKLGQSWPAAKTWDSRKIELSREMVKELVNISKNNGYYNLIELLKTI